MAVKTSSSGWTTYTFTPKGQRVASSSTPAPSVPKETIVVSQPVRDSAGKTEMDRMIEKNLSQAVSRVASGTASSADIAAVKYAQGSTSPSIREIADSAVMSRVQTSAQQAQLQSPAQAQMSIKTPTQVQPVSSVLMAERTGVSGVPSSSVAKKAEGLFGVSLEAPMSRAPVVGSAAVRAAPKLGEASAAFATKPAGQKIVDFFSIIPSARAQEVGPKVETKPSPKPSKTDMAQRSEVSKFFGFEKEPTTGSEVAGQLLYTGLKGLTYATLPIAAGLFIPSLPGAATESLLTKAVGIKSYEETTAGKAEKVARQQSIKTLDIVEKRIDELSKTGQSSIESIKQEIATKDKEIADAKKLYDEVAGRGKSTTTDGKTVVTFSGQEDVDKFKELQKKLNTAVNAKNTFVEEKVKELGSIDNQLERELKTRDELIKKGVREGSFSYDEFGTEKADELKRVRSEALFSKSQSSDKAVSALARQELALLDAGVKPETSEAIQRMKLGLATSGDVGRETKEYIKEGFVKTTLTDPFRAKAGLLAIKSAFAGKEFLTGAGFGIVEAGGEGRKMRAEQTGIVPLKLAADLTTGVGKVLVSPSTGESIIKAGLYGQALGATIKGVEMIPKAVPLSSQIKRFAELSTFAGTAARPAMSTITGTGVDLSQAFQRYEPQLKEQLGKGEISSALGTLGGAFVTEKVMDVTAMRGFQKGSKGVDWAKISKENIGIARAFEKTKTSGKDTARDQIIEFKESFGDIKEGPKRAFTVEESTLKALGVDRKKSTFPEALIEKEGTKRPGLLETVRKSALYDITTVLRGTDRPRTIWDKLGIQQVQPKVLSKQQLKMEEMRFQRGEKPGSGSEKEKLPETQLPTRPLLTGIEKASGDIKEAFRLPGEKLESKVETKTERVDIKTVKPEEKLSRLFSDTRFERTTDLRFPRTEPRTERVEPRTERVEPRTERVEPRTERVEQKSERTEIAPKTIDMMLMPPLPGGGGGMLPSQTPSYGTRAGIGFSIGLQKIRQLSLGKPVIKQKTTTAQQPKTGLKDVQSFFSRVSSSAQKQTPMFRSPKLGSGFGSMGGMSSRMSFSNKPFGSSPFGSSAFGSGVKKDLSKLFTSKPMVFNPKSPSVRSTSDIWKSNAFKTPLRKFTGV